VAALQIEARVGGTPRKPVGQPAPSGSTSPAAPVVSGRVHHCWIDRNLCLSVSAPGQEFGLRPGRKRSRRYSFKMWKTWYRLMPTSLAICSCVCPPVRWRSSTRWVWSDDTVERRPVRGPTAQAHSSTGRQVHPYRPAEAQDQGQARGGRDNRCRAGQRHWPIAACRARQTAAPETAHVGATGPARAEGHAVRTDWKRATG
jgi:hypothetical protein